MNTNRSTLKNLTKNGVKFTTIKSDAEIQLIQNEQLKSPKYTIYGREKCNLGEVANTPKNYYQPAHIIRVIIHENVQPPQHSHHNLSQYYHGFQYDIGSCFHCNSIHP